MASKAESGSVGQRPESFGPSGRENGKDIAGSSHGEGVKPTNKSGDGGHDGPKGRGPTGDIDGTNTAKAPDDAFAYLDVKGEEFAYLEHFRKEAYLEEGHNTVMRPGAAPALGFVDRARQAAAANPGSYQAADALQAAKNERRANRAPVIAARQAVAANPGSYQAADALQAAKNTRNAARAARRSTL